MRVRVDYPAMMKMEISGSHEVSENASLNDLKNSILQDVSQIYPQPMAPRTGGEISLQNRGLEILTDDTFRACLTQSDPCSPLVFHARFIKHHSSNQC